MGVDDGSGWRDHGHHFICQEHKKYVSEVNEEQIWICQFSLCDSATAGT